MATQLLPRGLRSEEKSFMSNGRQFQKLNVRFDAPGFEGRNKVKVQIWFIARDWLFRMSPHACNGFRVFLLRLFGAKVSSSAVIRPSAEITYPWSVEIGDHSYIGDRVCLYSLGRISIGAHVSVSMGATVCTGTHDFDDPNFQLIVKPVIIEDEASVCAESFIGPGVHIMRGGVLGARSVIMKGVIGEGEIWAGSPAKYIRSRAVSREGVILESRDYQ